MAPLPWKEDAARHPGDDFYFEQVSISQDWWTSFSTLTRRQEDLIKEKSKEYGWHWMITRPSAIVGYSTVSLVSKPSIPGQRWTWLTVQGNFMSIAVTLGLYASAMKHFNQPLIFPGSDVAYDLGRMHSTASNDAAFQVFAIKKKEAWDRIFNIDDGASVSYGELWPKVAK